MDVVCFGQQNWDYVWTGKQQICTRLAARGHRVLYVDPQSLEDAAGFGETARALAPVTTRFGVRELAPGLFVYTHQHAPLLRWRLNQWRRPRLLRALASRLAFDGAIALVHHPGAEPLIPAVTPSALVYYAVDEATAFGTMPEAARQRTRDAEERLARAADTVFAISPLLFERLAAIQPRTYLLESAADVEHFAPARLARAPIHPTLAPLTGPRLGFVGQIDERIDQPLLVSIARARPTWHIVLAGRVKAGVNITALAAEPNIHLLGHQPYELLPSVLRDVDVCIAPYRLTPLTNSCSPLKVYEYLATGRPVVSTPVHALLGANDVVALAETPEQFLAAVEAAIHDSRTGRDRRLAFAAENSWDRRVDVLEERLEETAARHRRRPTAMRPSRVRRVYASRTTGATVSPASEQPSLRVRVPFALLCGAGWVYYGLRVAARFLTGRRPVGVRTILVARRSRLGDLVVFLPTLRALRAHYPHARIVLGVQRGMSAGVLLDGSSDVDEIRVLDHLDRSSRFAQLAGTMRLFGEGFDLVLSGGSYFLLRDAFLSGAPYRLGLDDGHPLQRLNSRVLPFDTTRHEADNNLALVEALGARIEDEARAPTLTAGSAATRGFAQLANSLALPPDAPVLTVHPGSQKPSHRWPAERFAELVRMLLTEHPALRVVFSGIPDEAPLVEVIRTSIPPPLRERALSSIGHADIPTLIGLLARSRACLCNDTGVLHIARACGTPLVALLGAEDDRRWGPYPTGPAPAVALRYRVPCAPCVRWSCAPLYCLRSIAVHEVMNALSPLLARAVRRPDELSPATTSNRTERRGGTRAWGALAGAFELPLVSVTILDDGRCPVERLTDAVATVARQSYPCIEILVPRTDTDDAPDVEVTLRRIATTIPITIVQVSNADTRAVQREVEELARGELVVPLKPGAVWTRDRVAEEAAAFVRSTSDAPAAPILPSGGYHGNARAVV
jgi:ADP-heptose:LPS heptosyltransferase/glycosyltransferase involved in cell wall biosynthesis